jgi:hypothetical protein
MFPASAATQDTVMIHYPQWETNYDEAVTLHEDDTVRVTETILYYFDIASSVPETSSDFMKAGTYKTNGSLALAAHHRGWEDPAEFRPDATLVCDYLWKSNDEYEITEYPEIGIQREEYQTGVDADGNPVMAAKFHPVYMVEYCMFGGIDTGGEVEVSNPCNWDSGDEDDLPSPLLIDTEVDEGDYDPENHDVDEGVRREYFAYLAVAKTPAIAPLWGDRFKGANPTKEIHTIAQAKVFNNKSWGLWTQDWQVQLTSVNGFPDWVDRVQQDIDDDTTSETDVNSTDLQDIFDFLKALAGADMAGKFLVH